MRDYAFILLDLDGMVTSWNSGAENVLGYAAHEIIGQSGAKIFTADDVETGAEAHERQTALMHGRAEDERWEPGSDLPCAAKSSRTMAAAFGWRVAPVAAGLSVYVVPGRSMTR